MSVKGDDKKENPEEADTDLDHVIVSDEKSTEKRNIAVAKPKEENIKSLRSPEKMSLIQNDVMANNVDDSYEWEDYVGADTTEEVKGALAKLSTKSIKDSTVDVNDDNISPDTSYHGLKTALSSDETLETVSSPISSPAVYTSKQKSTSLPKVSENSSDVRQQFASAKIAIPIDEHIVTPSGCGCNCIIS